MLSLERPSLPTIAPLPRARGEVALSFVARDGRTDVGRRYEAGAARVRFAAAEVGAREAILVNVGGGITGGDRFAVDIAVETGADVTITSAAAEKVYRAIAEPAAVTNRLSVAAGARAAWMPQETILFDGASLRRSLAIDIAGDARLLAVEAVILGRVAMGEEVRRLSFHDRWDVRRDGRLVLADRVDLSDGLARARDARCGLGGAAAFATLLIAEPSPGDLVEAIRAALADAPEGVEGGAGEVGGLVVVRLVAARPQDLRSMLARLLPLALRRPTLPRIWSC